MAREVEYEEISADIEGVYVYEEDTPNDWHLAFKINYKKKIVEFFPSEEFAVKKVTFEGFDTIPSVMNEKGYFKAGLGYYLNKKLSQHNVQSLIISKNKNTSIKKLSKGHKIILNYGNFNKLKKDVTALIQEGKAEKSQFIDDFFAGELPKLYKSSGVSANRRAKKVINNLDEKIIEKLSSPEIEKILDFVEAILKTKFSLGTPKHKLFAGTKLKVDNIAISEVLDEFDSLMKKNPNEAKWGQFLKKNLYLLDSKYIHVLPQLNVVLATSRNVDFGLVDSQGFLDIFEIKKPDTKLLASSQDRGNYYWSTDAIKAITQAEKYLFNAESKRSSLADDIKREVNISVKVVKPRAFLIMGETTQLDSQKKIEDFRVLRMSLKNLEIILYDELIERLKNQQNKIYISK
ncbi:Shedu immune nuclease family protein [Nitrospina gracilis]|uniref:Shedu immune nuclease family protein n=1 Tax=Nitrospina gracilis TaxID=35801 RepID=UPI001F3BFFC9|nr:Shedu immune nuclease family protein [Nitrospina gracilis]MCF8721883.1 hypothetical protein [Nitrospina gracilis Nb-211]